MSRLRLYSGPLSMFGAKAQIAAFEKGIDFELVMVPYDKAYEPKHPDVLRVNPKKQVPIVMHGDLELFDSTQIFEYFEDLKPDPPLWPGTTEARARARLLELKSDEVFFPEVIRLMGLPLNSEGQIAVAARVAAARFYQQMEALLVDREYVAGRYTFADIAFYMAQLFAARVGAAMSERTPRLLQWRQRITERPAVRRVIGPMVTYLRSKGRAVPDFLSELAADVNHELQ